MAKTEGEARVKVTFNLSATLVKQAKHYAVDAGKSLQEVVADALRAYLKGGRAVTR